MTTQLNGTQTAPPQPIRMRCPKCGRKLIFARRYGTAYCSCPTEECAINLQADSFDVLIEHLSNMDTTTDLDKHHQDATKLLSHGPAVTALSRLIFEKNVEIGWERDGVRTDPGTALKDPHRIVPEKLALIHSEISEALEGYRKSLMDDHLPHHPMVAVELADAVIRIFDLAGALNIEIGTVMVEKVLYNWERPDHKRENRVKEGGKQI